MKAGFRVINGTKKNKPDLSLIYLNALIRNLHAYGVDPENRLIIQRVSFYYVKCTITIARDKTASLEELTEEFKFIDYAKDTISLLTPNELMQIFPINKEYDGEKRQSKDYFYTMNILRKHGLDNVLGDNVERILFDYQNNDIRLFLLKLMSVVDDLRRHNGHKSCIEEFFESQGTPLTTYTETHDNAGRKIMINNATGETHRIIKKFPRYLKPLKGGVSQ